MLKSYLTDTTTDAIVKKVIANLNRIPKDINSKIVTKDMIDEISKKLYDELRRKISI